MLVEERELFVRLHFVACEAGRRRGSGKGGGITSHISHLRPNETCLQTTYGLLTMRLDGAELGEQSNSAFHLNKCQGRHVMYAKLLDHLAPDNLPAGEMICDTGIRRTAELRQTTAEELLHLGRRQVVYLRAGTSDGGEVFFVIHGADGTSWAAIEDVETAMAI